MPAGVRVWASVHEIADGRWSRTLRCSVRSTLNVAQDGTLLLPEPAIRR